MQFSTLPLVLAHHLSIGDEQPVQLSPAGLADADQSAIASAKSQERIPGFLLPMIKKGPPVPESQEPVQITQKLVDALLKRRIAVPGMGAAVKGVPGLEFNLDMRSITLMDVKSGEFFLAGTKNDAGQLAPYAQMSQSKPVAEALAIRLIGFKAYSKLVGCEPTGRLYSDSTTSPNNPGKPLNANVNIGALRVWDIITQAAHLIGSDPFELYLDFLRSAANNPTLDYNPELADKTFKLTAPDGSMNNNRKLMKKLQEHGAFDSDPEEVYRHYCRACAVMINSEDGARIRAALHTGIVPGTEQQILSPDTARYMTNSISISGMYTEAGTTFGQYNASAKSGVAGGVMGIIPSRIPGQSDIAFGMQHGELDVDGNSHESLERIKDLSRMALTFAEIANSETLPEFLGDASQQVRHDALLETMTPNGIEALKQAIALKFPDQSTDFYLKSADDKHRHLFGERLLTVAGKDGENKDYYWVENRSQLNKIVVLLGTRQTAMKRKQDDIANDSAQRKMR